ncbi:MAG: alpha/beta hydrolase [Saprospiraceae bacterium]|nr:alpha/beta hydrolase [Saprospiraceae bacterium]
MTTDLALRDITLRSHIWDARGKPKGIVMIVHGIAEHMGRYEHVAQHLRANGFLVASYDQRGHGKSGGERAYIDDWDQYLDDLKVWHKHLQVAYTGLPFFFFSHSLGGLVVFHYLVRDEPDIDGAVFSAPALKVSEDISPFLQKIAPLLGRLFPKLKAMKINVQHISRDPQVVADYVNDPLVYSGGIYAKTGAVVLTATKQVAGLLARFQAPFLVMQGSNDKLTDPAASEAFYREATSSDKQFREFPGLYHELVNEPEKDKVLKIVTDWLNARI